MSVFRRCLLGLVLLAGLLPACSREAADSPGTEHAFLALQLEQLETLPLPAGVEPGMWSELKDELRTALEARLADAGSGKSVRAAPVSSGARIPLRFDLDAQVLRWRYFNPGDYDQNGEVNINDLTPLAAHFNAQVTDGPDSIEAVVDGDGNGLVSLSDLTPIGANLGRRITEFNLYAGNVASPPLPQQLSDIAPFATVPITAFEGNRATGRVSYAHTLGAPLGGDLHWLRPADGATEHEGISSNGVYGANLFAALQASAIVGAVPLVVNFDAAGSSGPGKLEYSFDLDGDGVFSAPGEETTASETYAAAGVYTAAVRVASSTGLYDTTAVVISVDALPVWRRYTLPTPQSFDQVRFVACGFHEERIWYYGAYHRSDFDGDNTYAQTAISNAGSAWVPMDGSFSTTSVLSSRAVASMSAGQPALMFGQSDENYHRFVRALEPFPATWGDAEVVNTDADQGFFDLDEVMGWPASIYRDNVTEDLEYRLAIDEFGAAWWGFTLQLSTTPVASAALEVANGVPVVIYADPVANELLFVKSSNGSGGLWHTPVKITDASAIFFDSLIVLADGSPALVYHDYADETLMFLRASDASGDNWLGSAVIAAAPNSTPLQSPRAIMVGGIPHAFWRSPDGALMHCAAAEADGAPWELAEVVAGASGDAMPFPADIGGLPAVAYVSPGSTAFRFAIKY